MKKPTGFLKKLFAEGKEQDKLELKKTEETCKLQMTQCQNLLKESLKKIQ